MAGRPVPTTAVDRQGVVGTAGDQALDDLLAVHAEFSGQFGGRRRPAVPLGKFRCGRAQTQVQFLSRRGTFTDQLLSRKWRRTSP